MPNNTRQQGIWISTGDPDNVDERSMYAPGQLGSKVTLIQPTRSPAGVEEGRSKTYQYVRVDSGVAVAPFPGAVAWWLNSAQYLVTTAATNRGRVAGVFQGTVTPGNFCFIQQKGPGKVKFVDAPTSAPDATGKFVIPSATAGKADCVATAPAFPILGYAVQALQGGTAEAVVELDVPETND